MILDRFEQLKNYVEIHPLLPLAIRFLNQQKMSDLATGYHEIQGKSLFATVFEEKEPPRTDPLLECHRLYYDLQVALYGVGTLKWKPLYECSNLKTPYHIENDAQLFSEESSLTISWIPHTFAIFLPEDAHATYASTPGFRKVVLKLAVL